MPRYTKTKRPYQVGDYWLSKQARSQAWCRTFYDTRTQQTKRVSLRTADFEEAKRRLDDWFVLEHQQSSEKIDEVTIASIFARYFTKHASKLKTAKSYQLMLDYWLDFHGAATLSEATGLSQQEAFLSWLQNKKVLSANTISKVITVGKAALNWAYKRGEIARLPYIEMVKVPQPDPKGRHLEVSEVAKLLTLAEHRHLKLFLLLLIGTAARPRAIYDLRFDQIDFEQNLIDLNPKGRVASRNKRRPVVKLPAQLKPVLQAEQLASETDAVISYNGEAIKSLRTTWRKLRTKAQLDEQVMLYSFRRTMARYMRIKGVPAWELAEQLGHRSTGYQITEIYTSHSPDYLEGAVSAIEAYLGALSCEFRVSCLTEILT